MSDLGLKGIAPHAIDAEFAGGRSSMWLATMALTGRYRADNDAYARSIGYPIQALPLIPLVGSIVTEHPAEALEIYELVLVFRDARGAGQWLEMQRDNVRQQSVVTSNGGVLPETIMKPVALGDEAIAVTDPPVGEPIATATRRMVATRVGRTVVSLSAGGGPSLDVTLVESLAATGLRALANGCSSK
jgi:hypothetical protein